MSILQSLAFYLVCGLFTWAFITLKDRWRARSPSLTFEQRQELEDEKIPTWGWIGSLVFFLLLIVLVPFVGFAADLT